jgi:Lon protease-like protein
VTAREDIPLFPLNTVLFPGGPLPLRIFEPRYVDMVRKCMREGAPFGVLLIRAGAEVGAVTSTADVGSSARIVDFHQLQDGLLGITCVGDRRFRVLSRRTQADGLHIGEIEWLNEAAEVALPPEHKHLSQLLGKVLPELGDLYSFVDRKFDDTAWVAARLAEILPISLADKQEFLEMDDPRERLAKLAPLIRRAGE